MAEKPSNCTIHYVVSEHVRDYLRDIAQVGLYGRTPTEVARNLMLRQLEVLIVDKGVVPKRLAPPAPEEIEGDGEPVNGAPASRKRRSKGSPEK
ncbi:hypothetical protein JN531_016630 (plasmid) [Flagellatimonas centrodinii]|uniref:hypothetical protein n=1 Tax=Flagellatimonas centrodinii TaxID=2806210 RepID=UPI001FEFD2B0|nr:hypothetical protein [Flagellatimonas centrodinii]ULQ48403.1 hypothetical protein JN531_016630 [Flagellatimonas centrodinii]